MAKSVILTGKAVVSFRKVIENPSDFELEQLLESDDYRGAVIEEDDLTDLEWIHDDVDIEVTP